MERKEILEKMRPVFCDIFDVDEREITEETVAEDVPEWDSLNQIILIASLEDVFSMKFEMEEIMMLKSIAALLDYIGGQK